MANAVEDAETPHISSLIQRKMQQKIMQLGKRLVSDDSNRSSLNTISVPKTIGDRLKSTPAKHDSPVDSQKNTLLLSHDIQDMVNDRDDDDDVIIIDNVPEVIVIPSDDAPNNDLPCVIANIKSEPLENELQTSKTKHTVTPQNRFKCKTMVTQLPKVTKDVFKCRSDGNKINDDKVLSIEEIKREPELKGNSEMNVSMESTFGIINTQSMTTNNVNTINNIKKLIPKTKQTLLTDVSRNLESDVKIEVIKSEEEKLMREDLSDIQLNKQKREEGRPADMSNNLEQITPKESEVSEPLKAETIVETVVEVDIPWDAVLIKEESDPEMDLQISDTRRIYHVDVVNVGENKIDVKQEINEFDSTGLSENWHQDSFPFSHFITITPNVALNTDDESNRTQRKKEICKVCYADVTRVDFIKHWDTHLDLNNLNRRLKSPEVLLPQLPHGFQTLDHDDTPDIKKALTEPLPHRERNTPNVLVADDAFPLSENIIKPYSCDLNRGSPKRVCNYRISRARRVVENKIGQEMHYFMSQLGSVPWQSAYL
ncbi:unnamed protein product [Pieris macdunnoughi]|uniref:Uncharacterized protein n=1 Tax=Pieris macdunnoughi TaxID=345717 RepID=A0A821W4E5_9NEOP|nr:unnamed protein product [Pieris macdunnoughi]